MAKGNAIARTTRTEVRELTAHMEHHMSDRNLIEDFRDCLLPVATTEAARERLEAYYRARKAAPYFKRHPGHNNHRYIDPTLLRQIMSAGSTAGPTTQVRCIRCGADFAPRRSTARYCSNRCRQRAKNSRSRDTLTADSGV